MAKRLGAISGKMNPIIAGLRNKSNTTFRYYKQTTIPREIAVESDKWSDESWHNDSSACCWTKIPTAKNPKAVLVLWVQPDDVESWLFPEAGRFQLDFIADGEEGWDDTTSRIILQSNDIQHVMAEIKMMREQSDS